MQQAEAVRRLLELARRRFGGELGREVEEERERGGHAVRGEAGVSKAARQAHQAGVEGSDPGRDGVQVRFLCGVAQLWWDAVRHDQEDVRGTIDGPPEGMVVEIEEALPGGW
jgi:hypothetical protein